MCTHLLSYVRMAELYIAVILNECARLVWERKTMTYTKVSPMAVGGMNVADTETEAFPQEDK